MNCYGTLSKYYCTFVGHGEGICNAQRKDLYHNIGGTIVMSKVQVQPCMLTSLFDPLHCRWLVIYRNESMPLPRYSSLLSFLRLQSLRALPNHFQDVTVTDKFLRRGGLAWVVTVYAGPTSIWHVPACPYGCGF